MVQGPLDLASLEPGENEGYGRWALPCERDEQVAALVHVLSGSGTEQAQPQHAPVLLAFAERMATLARREKSPERFRNGLLAAGLASSGGDQREVLIVLPLLWRTAEVLGLDAAAEFRSATYRLEAGDVVGDFVRRRPADRSIEVMGYVEVDDELGFRYERTW